MDTKHDYYEILQVHPKADLEAIQAAYERLRSRYDPGRLEGAADELVELAQHRLAELEQAYSVLSDLQRRTDYDAEERETHTTAVVQVQPLEAASNMQPDEMVLEYRPLPPARRQERPRDFNPQPMIVVRGGVEDYNGQRASAALPAWIKLAMGMVALILIVIMSSLMLVGGRLSGADASQAASNTNNTAPTPEVTLTTEELLRAVDTRIATVRQAAQAAPTDVKVWIDLGNILYDSMQLTRERLPDSAIYIENLPRWLEAGAAYEKALEMDPKNAAVRADLAACLCYYGAGIVDPSYIEKGLTQAQHAMKDNPNDGRVLLNLGVCLISSDPPQTEEALEHWRKVLLLTSPEPGIAAAARQLIAKYE